MRSLIASLLLVLGACATSAPPGTVPPTTTATGDPCTEADQTTFFADRDGDGFGDPDRPVQDCGLPPGAAVDATDCDDGRAEVYPGNAEICDGLDNDCNGLDDDAPTDGATWHPDADGDGFGAENQAVVACMQPPGTVEDGTDCDDAANASYPSAPEICDEADNDCDTDVDEGVLLPFYGDGDGDGYGRASQVVQACTAPPGSVADATDCDDLSAASYPGAPEVCDQADNDCDVAIDEGVQTLWYDDLDHDGYGWPIGGVLACNPPLGRTDDATDCDDGRVSVHPGADEVCNGLDDDCDDAIDDEPVDWSLFFVDADGDGFGDPTLPLLQCFLTPNTAVEPTDCLDSDPAIHPAMPEVCDGVDNDCSGAIDDEAVDATVWHVDLDLDGYGSEAVAGIGCIGEAGWIADGTDCDDAAGAVSPAEDEVCGGVDEDCSGAGDDAAVDAVLWYRDLDGDGYGTPAPSLAACVLPAGYSAVDTDCDDALAIVSPAAPEDACGNEDDDCDGTVDEDCYLEVCGPVNTVTIWAYPRIKVTCDVTVTAQLTIAPTSTVYFDPGTSLSVTGNGWLVGSAILYTASNGQAGGWDGLSLANPLKETFNDLDGSTVMFAGGTAALSLTGISTDISGLTITNALGPSLATSNYDGDLTDLGLWRSGGTALTCATLPCWGLLDGVTFGQNHDWLLELSTPALANYDPSTFVLFENDVSAMRVTGGDLTTSTTLDFAAPTLVVGGDMVLGGVGTFYVLTDGSRLEFEIGTGIEVDGYATLDVDGAALGVVMTSAERNPSPGDWDGITNYGDLFAYGLTVEYGGNPGGLGMGIYTNGTFELYGGTVRYSLADGIWGFGMTIQDSVIAFNGERGIYASGIGPFDRNAVTDNGTCGLTIPNTQIPDLDVAGTYVRNGEGGVCLYRPVFIPEIGYDQVWPPIDAEYRLLDNLNYEGWNPIPTLTWPDGVQVDLNGWHLYSGFVSSEGILSIEGDPNGLGVRIRNGTVSLNGEGVDVITGAIFTDASLYASWDAEPLVQDSQFDAASIYCSNDCHLTLYRSTFTNDSWVEVNGTGAEWVDFSSNTFTGNEQTPELPAWIVAQHEADSYLCDPGQLLEVTGPLDTTETFSVADCGLLLSFDIQNGGDLTILPQTVWLDSGTELSVGEVGLGVLRADGVTFLGVGETRGAFNSLSFGPNSAGSSLVGATVSYGGGPGGNNTGMILCDNCNLDLSDATVSYSSSWGLFRQGPMAVVDTTGATFSSNSAGDVF